MDENGNKKKVGLIVLSLCLVGIVAIGVSYAWWRFTVMQTGENTAISHCLKLELSNESEAINLTNMYPITDEEGRKLTPYTFTLTNTCTVSAAYKLNMEMLEGTTLNSKYVAVTVNNGDINLLSSYDETTTVIDNSTESRTLDTGVLIPNGSKDYSVSIWMDKSVTLEDDAQNKVFKSKIVVNAEATETAIDKIIASVDTTGKCPTVNEDGSVNVTGAEDTDGSVCSAKDAYGDSYYYRGNVTNNYVKFGTWASDTPTSFVDSDGNEYDSLEDCTDFDVHCTELALAGKDMYWRIVRINGDGTVRVIYDGTSAHANSDASTDRQIGTTSFNNYWKKNNVKESTNSYIHYDNADVGYMYGNRDGIVEQSTQYSTSSYTNTRTYYIAKEYNYNTSTDRFTLKNPIAVKGSDMTSSYVGYYTFNRTSSSASDQYIYKITSVTAGSSRATIGYSYVTYGTTSKEKAQTNTNSSDIKTYLDIWYENNIKGTTNEQYVADNIFCNDRSISSRTSSTYTNKGYGNESTYYRWYYGPWSSDGYNSNMRLTCPQKNDAFTVNDTTKGNGALTYGIGLLTADEVALAGGWNSDNLNYYLYSGQDYWLASPDSFNAAGGFANGRYVDSDGSLGTIGNPFGARPVLNLSSEILKNGNGTADNPYHV